MEAVRPATDEDRARLVVLAGEFVAGLLGQRGGPLLFDSDPTAAQAEVLAERLIDAPGAADRLLVAGTLEGMVTGFAHGRILEHGDGLRRGVLDACYVEPAARGVGLGRLLLEAALDWFEARGVDGIDGTALPGDRQAKNFFESAGFKARMLTMHRPSR